MHKKDIFQNKHMRSYMKRYELVDHTADIRLKIFGRDIPHLFQNAGYAMFDTISDISKVACNEKHNFNLRADSAEELLVEWMGELLYVFDTQQILFSRFNVSYFDNNTLIAQAQGDQYNDKIHTIKTLVKAVTYHNLKISVQEGAWEARVVLDV